MTVAIIPGLGRFEIDWRTTGYPTPDPGADPWEIEITTVWWLLDEPNPDFVGIRVNVHAQWHVMSDGRTLSEHLEDWIFEHEEPETDMYDDYDLDF